MVSFASVLAILVTLFITLIVPIIIPIVYGIRNKGKGVWKAWLLGAAGFFVLQVIIRLPILNTLAIFPWFNFFAEKFYVWYCLLLALTAALFEVVARFGVAKILQKKINYQQGVAAGLGHGGIEAMVLIGMTYVNNLIYAVMINTGVMQATIDSLPANDPNSVMAAEQLQYIVSAMTETPVYAFYLAGYERILTIIFHTAMSLLVCYLVYKKKALLGVGIAFVAHFLIDFIAPLINGLATSNMGNVISQGTAYVLIYSILTVVALGAVVIILKICRKWKNEEITVVSE